MFSNNLKEKLLRVAGNRDVVDGNHPTMDGSSRGIKKRSYTEAEIISKLKAKPPRLISPGLRRRFLIRLAMALHSYGSSAARTEYLIDKAADKLDVKANISVFPSLILLSFPGTFVRRDFLSLFIVDRRISFGKFKVYRTGADHMHFDSFCRCGFE